MLTQKKTPHQRIRITLVGLAALLVVPMLMTFFALSPTANAARARLDHSPYLAQVKQLLLARAMHGCIVGGAGFDGNLTSAKVASGDWGGAITTTVGPILDGDDDGLFDCKQVVSAARNAFGYGSFTDMFCALKGEWRDNANLDCTSNITKGEYSGDKWNIPRDRGVYAIQVLEKKAGKSLKFDSALVNYSMAMAALLSGQKIGCKAEWRGYDSGDDAASNDIKADQRNKKIAVALADGTVAYGYYYIPDANKSVPLFSGAGAPYTAPGGIDTKMSCGRIAQWASDNAEAAAKSAKTEAADNTRKAVYDALLKKCIEKSGGGAGGPAEQICKQQVDSWMNACKDKMPSSGAVASSKEYVKCIAEQSKYDSGALSGISADTPSGQSGGDEKKPECAVKDLGWLICPVINFLADISDAAFAMIADNFLKIEPGLASGSEVQAAWGIMRNIANGAFIIMFLAIIISQLTGFGISNYGIKKMLPRLIIAAILVNVSIYICQIAVDLSNILGYGLRAGIGGIGDEITRANEIFRSGQGRGEWGGFALTVLAAGTAGILALAVLIGALVSGLVVMATIAVLLIARKALIVILIVISPLAFVAFLLPNTEKFFSKWRSIFVGLLMVFPTIGLLFGGGILAGAIVKAGGGNDMIMQIVGELIKVLPLIAVWSVLKKAIDVAGSISQHINNAGGRLGGGAKNWAKDRYANSRLGQMQDFRKKQVARRKQLMRAGAWKGDGLMDHIWRNRMSDLSDKINRSKLANNKILGAGKNVNYGIRSAAAGQDAVDKEELEAAEDLLAYQFNGDAAAALRNAGDNEILKHVAFKKLESTGKHGAEQMYEYLQGGGTISNRRMAETLTRMKDDHAGLFEMGRTAIDQMEQDGATSVSFSQQQMAELTAKGVNGLSDEKLARQASSAIKVAGETEFTKGGQKMVGVSADRAASVLDNKRINTSISGSARRELESIRNNSVGTEEIRIPHDTASSNNITEAIPSDTPMGRTFVAGTGRGPAPPQSPPSTPPNNQNNRNNNPPAAS